VSVHTAAPPRRGRARELMTLVAVPIGVVLVCVLLARLADPEPGLSYWADIHGDSLHVYEPQGVYGDNWNTAAFEPFSGGRVGLLELALALVAYGGTIVVGERILRSLVTRYRWPLSLRLGGAFLIGYIPVFALVRLVTLRVGTNTAPALCLAALAATAIVSLAVDFRSRHAGNAGRATGVRPLPVAVLLSAFAIVVWTIQSGRNYLVSDSVLLFLGVARGDYGRLDWLPPFGRQMDEFLFNYPMAYADRGSTTFALWFWLTNAIAKVSMVWLIVGVVWTLTKGRWLIAGLSSVLVLFASPLAEPSRYVSLFGGQNPAIYLGHAGRFLGIVLPFLILLVVSEGMDGTARWVSAGLGFAMMATSPHNVLYAGVTGLLLALIVGARLVLRATDRRVRSATAWIAGLGMVLVVGGPLVTYGTIGMDGLHGMGGVALALGVAGALAASVALAVRGVAETGVGLSEELPAGHPSRLVAMGVGVLLGVLTMGNVFYKSLMEHGAYRSIMRNLFPAYREDPLFVMSFDSKPFTHASCTGVPTPVCSSFSGFASYLGPTFLAGVVALVVLLVSLSQASLRQRDLILVLLQLSLFEIGMFLTDFMGAADPATYWIQTRFLEIGYYGILIMLPVVLWNHLSGQVRTGSLLAVSAWFVVPLVANPFAQQWWENLDYLARVW
jgi:hypothetical protein